VGEAAFGDEVVDVGGPVLDGDVLDLGVLHRDEFDDGAVERGGGELGGGAAFHVGELGAFIDDDEGALELAEVFGVDAEVSLERVRDFDAGRHVDEGAAGEHGAVERGEFVVGRRDDFAEPLAEQVGVFAQGLGRVHEDDALLGDDLLDAGVGGLAVELGIDAGEELALVLRDAEALEGLFDVVGDFLPGALGFLRALREVVADFRKIEGLEILGGPVGGERFRLEDFERVVAKLADPRGLLFDRGDVVDRGGREAGAGVVVVLHVVAEIADALVEAGEWVDRGRCGGRGLWL